MVNILDSMGQSLLQLKTVLQHGNNHRQNVINAGGRVPIKLYLHKDVSLD